MTETITLLSGDARAEIALAGAEPLSWRVDGRELLWRGDADHWAYRAPILFPLVGASKGAAIRVDGTTYPMPQHGFARILPFQVVEATESIARFRLTDGPETRTHYPFAFALDLVVELGLSTLSLSFEVTNTGDGPMPYGLGFHPAFRWPFDAPSRDGHSVVFDEAETAEVPEIVPGGLLSRTTRPIPIDGTVLPISPDLFKEALAFLNAKSRHFAFVSPRGSQIGMRVENFPHLAIWTKPTAPFLSLEAWAAHAEWEDADGDLRTREGLMHLAPGETGRHRVEMSWASGYERIRG